MNAITINDLRKLTFATIGNHTDPSQIITSFGYGKNKGAVYISTMLAAFDEKGAEHKYKVTVSSAGKNKIEDFGKTRAQIDKEERAAYDKLKDSTKKALESLNFDINYIVTKTIIGDAMEGRVKKLSLCAALGNRGVREVFQQKFPEVKTVEEAAKALQKYNKNQSFAAKTC